MRRSTLVSAVVLTAICSAASAAEVKTEEQKALYALGYLLGGNAKPFELSEAELASVQAGFMDAAGNKKAAVEPQAYIPKLQELQTARAAIGAKREKTAGEAFVAKAAAEKGATKLPSGVVIVPIKAGTGASPAATDTVKVHYHGTLTNGTVFDSSVQRGQPAEFPLNRVIKCWTEGVQKIKVGGKSKLICPSDVAYGDQGSPPTIGPGATLVFEVELLEIVKAPPAAAAPSK